MWSEKMSGRRRVSVSSSSGFDADSDLPPLKKRGVTTKTVYKWIADNDKTLNTTTWLKYDKADREHVATLKCIRSVSATMISCSALETTTQLMSLVSQTFAPPPSRNTRPPTC